MMVLALNFWRLLSQAETPVSEGHQVNKAAVACLVTSTLATPGREVPSTRNRIAILRSVAEENDVAIPEEGGTTRGACSGVSLASPFSLFQERETNTKESTRTCYLSSVTPEGDRPKPQIQNPHPPQPRSVWFLLLARRVFFRGRRAGMTHHWCVVDGHEPRSHGHGATMMMAPRPRLRAQNRRARLHPPARSTLLCPKDTK